MYALQSTILNFRDLIRAIARPLKASGLAQTPFSAISPFSISSFLIPSGFVISKPSPHRRKISMYICIQRSPLHNSIVYRVARSSRQLLFARARAKPCWRIAVLCGGLLNSLAMQNLKCVIRESLLYYYLEYELSFANSYLI